MNWPLSPWVPQRSTPDRYGFSFWVSQQLKLKKIPRPFCNWQHGWIWWEPKDAEDFGFHRDPRSIAKVVCKPSFVDLLQSQGVPNVSLSSLPYAYLAASLYDHTECSAFKYPGSLLLIPDHSSEANKVDHNISSYLDYVDSIKRCFSNISVMLYHLDYDRLSPIVHERGFTPLVGASPKCPNSMQRVKRYMDCHEFVSTNFIGSHVLYALYSDCRVSICGPYQPRDRGIHLTDVKSGLYSWEYVDRILHVTSLSYVSSHPELRSYVVPTPQDAPFNDLHTREFVARELGTSSLMTPPEISELLRWNPAGQLVGYGAGGRRKLLRKVNAFANVLLR
jgi:hypothetical protein